MRELYARRWYNTAAYCRPIHTGAQLPRLRAAHFSRRHAYASRLSSAFSRFLSSSYWPGARPLAQAISLQLP